MLINYFNDNAVAQDFDPQYEVIRDEGRSAFKAEYLQENVGLGVCFTLRHGNTDGLKSVLLA